MAAMTGSMNVQATCYAAAVETNGHRVEMITDENIEKHIMSLIKNGWSNKVAQGRAPATVIYFRDGVSEGQFAQVIDQEVAAMKKAFLKLWTASPKFLVVIASKRHHVRFFPQTGGDKNSNALPGTLVESGVTQPYENDFYLCAHAAIKGTARPVHYNVNGVTQPYENGFYWCACLATTQDLEVGQTPSFTSLLLGLRLRRWISSHRSIVHRDSCGLRMEEVEKQDQPYLWQTLPMEFSIILF